MTLRLVHLGRFLCELANSLGRGLLNVMYVRHVNQFVIALDRRIGPHPQLIVEDILIGEAPLALGKNNSSLMIDSVFDRHFNYLVSPIRKTGLPRVLDYAKSTLNLVNR